MSYTNEDWHGVSDVLFKRLMECREAKGMVWQKEAKILESGIKELTDKHARLAEALTERLAAVERKLEKFVETEPVPRPVPQPAARIRLANGDLTVPRFQLGFVLSIRAYNALRAAGMTNIYQTVDMSNGELLAIKNFGKVSLREVRKAVAELQAASPVESQDATVSAIEELALGF